MKRALTFLLMFLVMVMLTGMATASTSSPIGLTTDITHADPTAGTAMAAMLYACAECKKENLMGPPMGTLSMLIDEEKDEGLSPSGLLASLHNPGKTYLPDIMG